MSTYSEVVGEKLNGLLEKNYDAEKGFKKAAENAEHSNLKTYFQKKAQQRHDFGHELKNEIKSFGQEVDKGDSLTSKAHRTWMDVKAMFSSNNDEAMLEEALRGEKASLEEYNEVLDEHTLPPSTAMILKSQKSSIESALATVKRLEDVQ